MSNRVVAGDGVEIIAYSYATRNLQIGVNVLHYFCSTSIGLGATDQEIADGFSTAVAPAYKAWLNNFAIYYGASARKLHPPTSYKPANSLNGGGAGTSGATPMPNQTCGIVTWQTNFAGRRARGRSYFPFPATALSSGANEVPSGGAYVLMAGLATVIVPTVTYGSGGNTSDLTFCIFKRNIPNSIFPVTYAQPRYTWGTQRRRGDYGRTNSLPF